MKARQTFTKSPAKAQETKEARVRIGLSQNRLIWMALFIGLLALWPGSAFADELDTGDTAWMLTSMVLVLFMTIPGLSLFYAGLVRAKNVLSVLMQCFAITGLASVVWAVCGYSLAFDVTGMEEGVYNLHSFVGGLGNAFLMNVTRDSMVGTIPETVFLSFQMTFAIITPALICGAYAERMKFSAMMIFTALWLIVVYSPICHMAWSGDGALFVNWGVLDFAGGTVVHINAGIAALAACILVGKRTGFPKTPMPPHNMTMCVTGAAMLWVGWFGFNAGSELAADNIAGMAMLATHLSTATAALTWMCIEWVRHGKPSALGIATGAVAGLVAITPASGTAGPMGAIVIGFAAGGICYLASTSMKRALGYDDSLDAFGVHCIGGIVGALLTGVFAHEMFIGAGLGHETIALQVWAQTKAILVTLVWSGVLSIAILKAIDLTIGLRVDAEEESQGLDVSLHEEQGYIL